MSTLPSTYIVEDDLDVYITTKYDLSWKHLDLPLAFKSTKIYTTPNF